MTTQKKWLSIVDYSKSTDLSISTIRRRIKNRKVVFKKQNGKFFIFCESEQFHTQKPEMSATTALEDEIRRLRELVSEQDMLIKLYEERLIKKQDTTLSNKEIWGNYTPGANQ